MCGPVRALPSLAGWLHGALLPQQLVTQSEYITCAFKSRKDHTSAHSS